jgi:hypothetical protein
MDARIREDLQDPAGRARGAAPKPEPDDSNESRNEVNGFSKGIFVVFLLRFAFASRRSVTL